MDEETSLHKGNIESLIQMYGHLIDNEKIKKIYSEIQSNYTDAMIRQYLPVLIKRDVKATIQQIIINTDAHVVLSTPSCR